MCIHISNKIKYSRNKNVDSSTIVKRNNIHSFILYIWISNKPIYEYWKFCVVPIEGKKKQKTSVYIRKKLHYKKLANIPYRFQCIVTWCGWFLFFFFWKAYLSFGFGHTLITGILRFARWLFTPYSECDACISEY